MFKIFLLVCLVVAQAHAAIYGRDDRRDISSLRPEIQQTARAVAANIPSFFLIPDGVSGKLKHEDYKVAYGELNGMCSSERFLGQTSFGHCTSFLVHERVLVTAGHCLIPTGVVEMQESPYCDNFSFWLGYNNKHNWRSGRKIDPRDVVRCKKVIYAQNNETDLPTRDFAILELTNPVTHIKPIKINSKISVGDKVFALGHPNGLPLKYSGRSKIREVGKTSFSALLDTLGGNSGGPVLNTKNQVVGVLVSGHQKDFYKSQGCYKINQCDNQANHCKATSKLDPVNHMIKMSILLPYIENYLKQQRE